MSFAPATMPWFAVHEARLMWRDGVAMMTGGYPARRIALIIVLVVAAVLLHLLANANALRLASRVVGPDATLMLPPLAADEASAHLDALLAALRAGMQSPLPVARRTAFAWLRIEAANQGATDDKRKHPASAARQSYDHAEHRHGHGEVDDDACLQREWPDFDALHAAGFEEWLHLYRPLLVAARNDGGAA